MHLSRFLLYSTLGTAIWTTVLTYAGLQLGENYDLVEQYLAPGSKIVVTLLVGSFLVWAVRRMRRSA